MRFGVFLLAAQFPGQSHRAVLDAAVAAAVAAEQAGFDEVWIAEHHFISYGICPSAITMAGYLLGATRRVTVGTAVSVLSTQHPVALAEQTLLLDQLSAGRFRLGVGRGGPWVDLEVFGTGAQRHDSGLLEGLDVLLGALRGPAVRGAGPTLTFPEVEIVPGPYTRPHPEVVVAATSTPTVEVAARRGLPLLLGMHADDTEKAALLAQYARLAPHQPARHISAGIAYVADTDEQALSTLRTQLPRWLRPGLAGYRRADGAARSPRDSHEYTELLCRLHPVGSAERCRERLATTATRTGIEHVILMVEGAGDRHRTRENIQRLGAEVLPELRHRDPPRP